MVHLETRREWFRCGVDQSLERVLVEGNVAVLGRFALLEFLSGRACFRFEFEILNDVLWRLRNDVTDVIKTFSACASRNLVEVACGEDGRLVAAVLAKLRKENRADRHVHAYAKRICAADDFEQPLLGEFFAEDAVLGQKSSVVQSDALLKPALDIRTVRACEADFFDGFVDLDFFFFCTQVKTHEVLCVAGGGGLRKVDYINRSFSFVHELLHFGRNFCSAVAKVERHRALRGSDGHGFAAGMLGHVAFEKFSRADGRAHQEESRLRECQKRNLPCDTAFAVGVVVEFVHHDVDDGKRFAFAERHVRKDFCSTANNGGVTIDGGVTRRKPYIFGSEFFAECHPFFVHESLDGAGIDASASMH